MTTKGSFERAQRLAGGQGPVGPGFRHGQDRLEELTSPVVVTLRARS